MSVPYRFNGKLYKTVNGLVSAAQKYFPTADSFGLTSNKTFKISKRKPDGSWETLVELPVTYKETEVFIKLP
jgi:hypothetical protein